MTVKTMTLKASRVLRGRAQETGALHGDSPGCSFGKEEFSKKIHSVNRHGGGGFWTRACNCSVSVVVGIFWLSFMSRALGTWALLTGFQKAWNKCPRTWNYDLRSGGEAEEAARCRLTVQKARLPMITANIASLLCIATSLSLR